MRHDEDCTLSPDHSGHCYPHPLVMPLRMTRAAPDPAPLDVERFGDAVMAALRLRLIHGATDATYTPREVAEMVGHVIEKQVAAIAREYAKEPQP